MSCRLPGVSCPASWLRAVRTRLLDNCRTGGASRRGHAAKALRADRAPVPGVRAAQQPLDPVPGTAPVLRRGRGGGLAVAALERGHQLPVFVTRGGPDIVVPPRVPLDSHQVVGDL